MRTGRCVERSLRLRSTSCVIDALLEARSALNSLEA
jgi:hypothetical protein